MITDSRPAGFVESGANPQDQSSNRRTRTPPVLVISATGRAVDLDTAAAPDSVVGMSPPPTFGRVPPL